MLANVGTIVLFAGDFTPQGCAECDGRLLTVNSNNLLFTLLGRKYGGDGFKNFALPKLPRKGELRHIIGLEGMFPESRAISYEVEFNDECTTGIIVPFSGQQVPDKWLPCDGRVLEVYSYQALFSLLGRRFSGNLPPTQFMLPNLNTASEKYIICADGIYPMKS